MSHISKEDIEKLAELALLDLLEEEKIGLQNSINNILGYVSMVTEADLAGVSANYNFTSVSRSDEVSDKQPVFSKDILNQNVRQLSEDGFVEVSKVINK
jgi:aspartyl/glutamyl-tRNA(Asn/Gln) amidotransferase C subunit